MKVVFIANQYSHPISFEFAKSVTNDHIRIKALKIVGNSTLYLMSTYVSSLFYLFKVPKADVYLLDSTPALLIGYLKKKFFNRNCKLILRSNDKLFFFDGVGGLKLKFLKMITKKLDGVIAISEMVKEAMMKTYPKMPTEIVYVFPQNEKLFDIKPDYKNRNIISLGIAPALGKGTDVQVEVNKILNDQTSYIMGKIEHVPELVEENKDNEKIKFINFGNPSKYFAKSIFLLHSSRFDAGGNVVLEGMAAGLIPIVSSITGNKDLVMRIDERLVVDGFKAKDYAKVIKTFSKMSDDEIKKISDKSKKIAKEYSRKNQLQDFKTKFSKLANN